MQTFPFEEFESLSQRSSKINIFYEEFLTKFAMHTGAMAGVAWDCTNEPFRSICQINAPDVSSLKLPLSEKQHQELLTKSLDQHHPILVMPQKSDGSGLPALVLGPIRRQENIELVEFVLPTNETVDHQKTLKHLQNCCELASKFVENDAVAEQTNGDVASTEQLKTQKKLAPEQISRFVRVIHSSLDYKVTTANVANEGRLLLDCDRVSVALANRNSFQIQAISGQPSVNRRSNNAYLLRRVVNKVLRTGQPFWYPTDEELPASLENALNDYLSESATRSIVIEPVMESLPADDTDPHRDQAKERVIGGIIAESCARQWERKNVEDSIEVLNRHGGDAIRNAVNHKSLFLYPIWRLLGKSKVIGSARNLPKSVAVGLLVLFAILALVLIPWNFNVSCNGIIVPCERQRVYAEIEGKVSQLNIQHASNVVKEQTIINLTSDSLDMELQELIGRRESLKRELDSAKSMRLGDLSDKEQRSVQENSETLEANLRSVKQQLIVLESKRKKLEIKSPLTGDVITWDFEERLKARPVKDGDFLVEIANVEGRWEIELALPDKKICHVMRAANKQKDPLKVTFILAANPNVSYTGRVKYIAESTQLQADQKQSVKVVVEFDSDAIELKHARSEVQAKIHCGKKSVGYVWLHPVGEFIQSQIFFRLW